MNKRGLTVGSAGSHFDMAYWLEDPRLIYRAHRLGIKNILTVEEVPGALQLLIRDSIVSSAEALDLLQELQREGEQGGRESS
jgi:hypothetical protein